MREPAGEGGYTCNHGETVNAVSQVVPRTDVKAVRPEHDVWGGLFYFRRKQTKGTC